MADKSIAEIVLGLPIEGPFSYSVPLNMRDSIQVGKRVWVPFRNATKVGYCVGFAKESSIVGIKPIQKVIDDKPLLDDDMLKLTKWISQRYFCYWGEAIEAALPSPLKKGKTEMQRRSEWEEVEFERSDDLTPSRAQGKIIESIQGYIEKNEFKPCLLYGITGSGKTEIYLQAIKKALALGKSSIVLVPEISLTPQTAERFKSRFGDKVSIMHSRLTDSQRFHEWKKIKEADVSVVVGARSAIFAPVKNLGLVAIDEEHETAYKQEDAPRYNAREVAIERARLTNAVLILGSATPSMESFYMAKEGKFVFFELPERVQEKELPRVALIDMRDSKGMKASVISKQLELALAGVLEKKEQAILFLNRRGFSTFIYCKKCGFVCKCRYCSITMTYHSSNNKLRCHMCNFEADPPKVCPKCESSYIKSFGIGTQKVESEMARLFPQARVARMDADTTAKRGSHYSILSDFKKGDIDVLIGTQMIAKGLDFPKVTLVGVISADTALNIPDFRASERTFNLLTQVAGRAGRGVKEGKVIIQTYMPFHYAIEAAKDHDYEEFYEKEIKFRKELDLPPFTSVANLILRGRRDDKVKEAADKLSQHLGSENKDNNVKIVGPAPAVIPKVRGQFRWCVMLKSADIENISKLLKNTLGKYRKPQGIIVTVDVDPL